MTSLRYADAELDHIDECLQVLGIPVWEHSWRLIAEGPGEWGPLVSGPHLPVEISCDALAFAMSAPKERRSQLSWMNTTIDRDCARAGLSDTKAISFFKEHGYDAHGLV